MDQLRAMRAFCRVAEIGTFAKAADSLDIGAAAVTRLVADLEEHLGARLINRTTRRLALTSVGEQYLERVKAILSDIDDAEAVASSATAELRGRLSVLAPASFTVHQLAKRLGAFHAKYPRVTLDMTVSGSVEVPDENHDVTLIVQRSRPIDGAFVARRIASTDVVLCATKSYLDLHGRPTEPAQLGAHNLLMPVSPGDAGSLKLVSNVDSSIAIDVAMAKAPPLTTTHTDTLYAAALGGMGIAAIPSMIAEGSLIGQALERVLPEWHLWTLTLFAAMPTRKHIPTRTRAFVDFLATTFGAEGPDPWLAAARRSGV